jgi:hypothetical protein
MEMDAPTQHARSYAMAVRGCDEAERDQDSQPKFSQ